MYVAAVRVYARCTRACVQDVRHRGNVWQISLSHVALSGPDERLYLRETRILARFATARAAPRDNKP